MVTWYEAEASLAEEIILVDVSEMEFTNEDGSIVETMPIKDLSGREMRSLQVAPELDGLSGTLDELSPKSHTMGLLITFERMFKGSEGELPFSFDHFLNWRSSRQNKLMDIFKKALGDVEKKSESSPSPTQDKPLETPLNTET
jgi:hypothetical protein